MPLEEELEYKKSYQQHLNKEFMRLENLDRNTPISNIILLNLGAIPYYINDMRFLVVKLKGNYFDFVKENGLWYKW